MFCRCLLGWLDRRRPRQRRFVLVAPHWRPPPAQRRAFRSVPQQRSGLNSFGVELLPEAYQSLLFKGVRTNQLNKNVAAQALAELERFGLIAAAAASLAGGAQTRPPFPDITAQMPRLAGRNVLEHFEKVGGEMVRPYRELLDGLLLAPHIPPPPSTWSLRPGWTR